MRSRPHDGAGVLGRRGVEGAVGVDFPNRGVMLQPDKLRVRHRGSKAIEDVAEPRPDPRPVRPSGGDSRSLVSTRHKFHDNPMIRASCRLRERSARRPPARRKHRRADRDHAKRHRQPEKRPLIPSPRSTRWPSRIPEPISTCAIPGDCGRAPGFRSDRRSTTLARAAEQTQQSRLRRRELWIGLRPTADESVGSIEIRQRSLVDRSSATTSSVSRTCHSRRRRSSRSWCGDVAAGRSPGQGRTVT